MRYSVAEMRRKLGANPLGLHAAKHRFHSISSRSPEKLHFLAYAMWDRREKNISNGVIQLVTPTYGFVRIGSKTPHCDPSDFRPRWEGEWRAPLNPTQRKALDALKTTLREKPSELAFAQDGMVDVESLTSYMSETLRADINQYGLDKIVFSLQTRLFVYQNQKKRIRLIREDDFRPISEEKSCVPPQFLYHATLLNNVGDIDCEGIQPIESSLVSLAESLNEAKSYFPEEENLFVYRVDAIKMMDVGYRFLKTSAGDWKTPVVPLQFLIYA